MFYLAPPRLAQFQKTPPLMAAVVTAVVHRVQYHPMARFAQKHTDEFNAATLDEYEHGYSFPTSGYSHISKPGLNEAVVREISHLKNEPDWMLQIRLAAYKIFLAKPTPLWGADLSVIDYDKIRYYLSPTDAASKSWDDVPADVKETFERLGIPEAERQVLAGVKAQYDSTVVYGSLKEAFAKDGVVFLSMDEGLQQYPDLVKEYFCKVISAGDNKFSALNTAVWSGGSFVYVPKGVDVKMPLQTYFRINAENAGQFERTLIIVDEGAKVHYLEGCTAPNFSSGSLHSAVVEIFVKKGARCQYTTIQNWYKNVYNLVTKRAWVEEEGEMIWTDFNMGCLTESARVYIHGKGAISIRDVKPGDVIWSVDLQSLTPIQARVVASKEMGTKETYRLITENSRSIEATGNHPFLSLSKSSLQKGYSRLSWKKLEDIDIGDTVAIARGLPDVGVSYKINFNFEKQGHAKHVKVEPSIPEETSEDLMWLLGLYVGDGYCEKDKKTGRWSRTYFAVPPEERARKKLDYLINKTFKVKPREKGICLTVPSVILTTFFQSLGLGGVAKEKRIPSWVYDLPVAQKLAFIEGYLDADGHVRNNKLVNDIQYGQVVFASANKELLEDFKLLLISVGLNPLQIATYSKFRSLYKGKMKYYTCHFLSLNLRKNLEQIKGKLISKPEIEFVRVRSIEKLGKQQVYDLEIENTANFIANGLVVHNSKITMKYPGFILAGKGARGETLSMALAASGQHQDTGSKAIHLAPYTSSTIISKSISKGGGRTSYRGLVHVGPKAHGSKNTVICDALLLDGDSRSDTYPVDRIMTSDVEIQHEATVSKIGDDQLFYLMSRGITEESARKLIVNGFIEDLVRKLPLEYAVEMNRLIDHEMEGSIG
jgi:Fe-S cluster assembly scaffold protein SufB